MQCPSLERARVGASKSHQILGLRDSLPVTPHRNGVHDHCPGDQKPLQHHLHRQQRNATSRCSPFGPSWDHDGSQ